MMSYTQKLEKISEFLKSTSFFWEKEIIVQNTEQLPQSYHELARNIENMSWPQRLKTYNYGQSQQIKELCNFPKSESEFPLKTLKLVKLKKQHELSRILNIVKEKTQLPQLIIDCCGGVGHLPQTLNQYLYIDRPARALTIEFDPTLIQKGQQRLSDSKLSTFLQADIRTFDFTPYSNHQTLTIGLHCCGELSESVLKSNTSQILNWGCCYHKTSSSWRPMSLAGKKLIPRLTNNALTLAAKCHKPLTSDELESRYKVKRYRYTLEKLGVHKKMKIQATGSLLKRFYQGSFSDYLQETFPQHEMAKNELEKFYQNNINKVERLIALGLLRDHWGRVIESAIILDRALYLEENGYEVEIQETFKRSLSPRNLMILAKKN